MPLFHFTRNSHSKQPRHDDMFCLNYLLTYEGTV